MTAGATGVLSSDFRRAALRTLDEPYKNIDAFVHSLCGLYRRRKANFLRLEKEAEKVMALAPRWENLSRRELRRNLREFGKSCRRERRKPLDPDLRREALAGIRESGRRETGLLAHKVQLIGVLALQEGNLIEMATGEGKTLVAAMAAVFGGWSGFPCHVITINDYLAKRDANWFRALFESCGLRVGFVLSEMQPAERRKAYQCDVTYTTSKEVTADFLRDRLLMGAWQDPSRRHIRRLLGMRMDSGHELTMRGLHTAIVDEADSVLIDEAVTPLILSRPSADDSLNAAALEAHRVAGFLTRGEDYEVNTRYREIEFSPEGEAKLDSLCDNLPGIWKGPTRRRELIEQALLARDLYLREKNYVVQDDKIVIVDEYSGRLAPNRSWGHGLQQAIEAKEGVPLTSMTETLARLSFQRFFRFFPKLSGMTGTAWEAAEEFWQIYSLPILSIPTHHPSRRRVLPDRIFATREDKWEAVVSDVAALRQQNRPVLVGVRNIEEGEELARRLRERKITFQLLHAEYHSQEASIIAQAGKPGRVTLATNMAGRGTDIRLDPEVAGIGGLHVLASERQESPRLDRQLFGRCARQGDPGSAQAFVSLEDDLLVKYLSAPQRAILCRGAGPAGNSPGFWARHAIRKAQWAAQHQAFLQRKKVLRMDHWLEDSLGFRSSQSGL